MRADNLQRHVKKICLVCMTAMLFAGCASKHTEPEAEVLGTEEATIATEEELVYGETFKITSMPSDMEALAQAHAINEMELYGWQIATGMGSEVVASAEAKGFLEFLFSSTGGSGEVTMTPVYRNVGQ